MDATDEFILARCEGGALYLVDVTDLRRKTKISSDKVV